MKTLIKLNVNGRDHELWVEPGKTLLEVLREDLGLTGTKRGCDLGECGACTVLVEGQPVLSCVTLPAAVQGKAILTVEGLGTPANPHPLQVAFAELGAAQCGFCTSGALLSGKALLDRNPTPIREEIKSSLAGNLCRCTGYQKIFDAIELAGRRMAGANKCACSGRKGA